MSVDQIADAQSVLPGKREITVDLAHLRIDHRGRAGFPAADQIRPAPTSRDLFENHGFQPLLELAAAYAHGFRLGMFGL